MKLGWGGKFLGDWLSVSTASEVPPTSQPWLRLWLFAVFKLTACSRQPQPAEFEKVNSEIAALQLMQHHFSAQYDDERICLCVRLGLCVCLSVCEHISETTLPMLTIFECYPWPWRTGVGPSLVVLRYAMYFRFMEYG